MPSIAIPLPRRMVSVGKPESVADGVVGPCSVCETKFWGKDDDKLRAVVIRHRITNDPPCHEKEESAE